MTAVFMWSHLIFVTALWEVDVTASNGEEKSAKITLLESIKLAPKFIAVWL